MDGADIDDGAVASDFVPFSRKLLLVQPRRLDEHVEMDVPQAVELGQFQLTYVAAALDGGLPERAAAESGERLVQAFELVAKWSAGVT